MRLLRKAFVLVVPTTLLPLYLKMNEEEQAKKKAKKPKKAKTAKKSKKATKKKM